MTPGRLLELLAGEQVGDLSSAERVELKALETRFPELARQERDALAAAAASLAAAAAQVAMPEGFRATLTPPRPCPPAWRPFLAGFATATGLSLVVAMIPPEAEPALTPDRLKSLPRSHRFQSQDGSEAVWDSASQVGMLEVRHLPPNDPRRSRYQIWVVDGARPEPHRRVDGGLFDVHPQETRWVPVRAALPVHEPQAFAVTEEDPAGAVVSQSPLLTVYTPVAP